MSSQEELKTPRTQEERSPALWGLMADMAGSISTLAYIARHDQLTGLLNKQAWKHEVQERIKDDRTFGVGFIDLSAFKKVNDTLGHERGEALLEEFGEYLRGSFRREGDVLSHETLFQPTDDGDSVGRYGGDEFGIIIDLDDEEPEDRRESNHTMAKTIDYFRTTFDKFITEQPADVRECGFDIAVGWTVRRSGDTTTDSEVIAEADKDMYNDKVSRKEQLGVPAR